MMASVSARPSPAPRCSGATKIDPIQPARPLAVPTPVATISPSASATRGTHWSWVVSRSFNVWISCNTCSKRNPPVGIKSFANA